MSYSVYYTNSKYLNERHYILFFFWIYMNGITIYILPCIASFIQYNYFSTHPSLSTLLLNGIPLDRYATHHVHLLMCLQSITAVSSLAGGSLFWPLALSKNLLLRWSINYKQQQKLTCQIPHHLSSGHFILWKTQQFLDPRSVFLLFPFSTLSMISILSSAKGSISFFVYSLFYILFSWLYCDFHISKDFFVLFVTRFLTPAILSHT